MIILSILVGKDAFVLSLDEYGSGGPPPEEVERGDVVDEGGRVWEGFVAVCGAVEVAVGVI